MNPELGSLEAVSLSVPKLEQSVDFVLQHNFDAVTKTCLITCMKLLDNCIQNPHNPIYRTVKLSNKAVQSKIVACKGGVPFLLACGFVPADGDSRLVLQSQAPDQPNQSSTTSTKHLIAARRLLLLRCTRDLGCKAEELPTYKPPPPPVAASEHMVPTGTFNPYKGHRFDAKSAAAGTNLGPAANYKSKTEAEVERLRKQQATLERTMQTVTDRGWTALRPGESAVVTTSAAPVTTTAAAPGSSDASLLATRAKQQAEERNKRENGGFTTAAMRDLERLKKQKVFSHATLQIQFPDGCKLTGKFLPTETIETVKSSVRQDCLSKATADSILPDFDLYMTPPRQLLHSDSTLQSEGLVPAAKIFVSWKTPEPVSSIACLRPALFQHSQHVSHQFPESQSVSTAAAIEDTERQHQQSKKISAPKKGQEEDLLRRMLGGKPGLSGKRPGVGDSKKLGAGGNDKPKWFKS